MHFLRMGGIDKRRTNGKLEEIFGTIMKQRGAKIPLVTRTEICACRVCTSDYIVSRIFFVIRTQVLVYSIEVI